jgi:hypothetical protein
MLGADRRRKSLFVIRGNGWEYLTAGAAFCKQRSADLVEIAEVTGVYADAAGIPHVKYDVVFEKDKRPAYREGPRNLALKAFLQNYGERMWK